MNNYDCTRLSWIICCWLLVFCQWFFFLLITVRQVKPRVGPLLALFQSSGRKEKFPCCYTLLIISLCSARHAPVHNSTFRALRCPGELHGYPRCFASRDRTTKSLRRKDDNVAVFFFGFCCFFFLVYVIRNPDRGYFSLPMKTSTSLVHVLSLLLLISQRYLPRWSCVAWGIWNRTNYANMEKSTQTETKNTTMT